MKRLFAFLILAMIVGTALIWPPGGLAQLPGRLARPTHLPGDLAGLPTILHGEGEIRRFDLPDTTDPPDGIADWPTTLSQYLISRPFLIGDAATTVTLYRSVFDLDNLIPHIDDSIPAGWRALTSPIAWRVFMRRVREVETVVSFTPRRFRRSIDPFNQDVATTTVIKVLRIERKTLGAWDGRSAYFVRQARWGYAKNGLDIIVYVPR